MTDNRIEVIVLREEGHYLADIAAKVKSTKSCVSKTLSRVRETDTAKE